MPNQVKLRKSLKCRKFQTAKSEGLVVNASWKPEKF